MSGSILPSYAANAYLYGAPMQAQPVVQGGPSFLTSLVANQPSPLTSRETAERSALETLLNISSGGQASDVQGGPPGAPSTGNVVNDIQSLMDDPAGRAAAQTALGMVANPASLPTTVVGTMLGQVPGVYGSVPAKGASAFGARAGLHGITQMVQDIVNAIQGYPEKSEAALTEGGAKGEGKPDSLSAEEAAAQQAAAEATNDVGGSKDGGGGAPGAPGTGTADDANANSTAAGQDAVGNDGTGAGGAGTGAGAPGNDSDGWASGGLVTYARGGVIALEGGGKVAVGPGGGLDDLIPTNIDGRRAAALSDGEFVIPADVVSMMGDGSSNAGARRLYDLVKQIREEKTGTSRQAGPLPVAQILKRTMS